MRESAAGRPRWVVVLAVVYLLAQLADQVWPRADTRDGSPFGAIAVTALSVLLAVFPNGRSVPRWMIGVAAAASVLWIAVATAGADVEAAILWPLPLAPLLLVLAIGGQGYRYVRRSSAAEREAARWPLVGVLFGLTIVLPADLVAVAITGAPLGDSSPFLAGLAGLAMLMPAVGILAGLLASPTELVDRLLAGWVTVVGAGVVLGLVFTAIRAFVGVWLDTPWDALAGAAAAVVGSVWVVPVASRFGNRVVFRGRKDQRAALRRLSMRLGTMLDPADIPAQVVESVGEATGAEAVVLRRSGHVGIWAQAGAVQPDAAGAYEVTVQYLGLPVAVLTVSPRPAESSLASADRTLIDALAEAAAPALHGARVSGAFPELTERERQVLAGIARGLPNAAIAARIGVSGKTVANYVSIVLTKLRVPDRERAAEVARRRAIEL